MEKPNEVKCRECGCTERDCSQCIARTGSPCYWVEHDLCSACAKPKPKLIMLNDLYNTVIFLQEKDVPERISKIYEEKLRSGYTLREDTHKHFNPKL